MSPQTALETLTRELGAERVVAALPQKDVCRVLKLKTVQQTAEELDVSYNSLRWLMSSGEIPYPSFRLQRRAYYTEAEFRRIRTVCQRKQADSAADAGASADGARAEAGGQFASGAPAFATAMSPESPHD